MAITKVPGTTTIKTQNPDLGFTPTVVAKPKPVGFATSPLASSLGLPAAATNPILAKFSVPQSTYGTVPNSAGTGAGAGSSGLTPPTMGQIDPSQYLNELTSDPLYQTGLSSYQSQIQANQNALSNALKQSVIQGGWAPGTGAGQVNLSNVGGQDLSGSIDQATIDAANANQMSDRAQLQQQLNKGLADIPSQLAARGAARSGAANVSAANVQNQYDVAANQALQNLSQAIGGNVSTWANNNANALANWNVSQGNIADRLASIAQANAQAAYNDNLNAYNAAQANQGPTANLGQTAITSTPTGPSPKTVAQIKSIVTKKQIAANPRAAQTARNAL